MDYQAAYALLVETMSTAIDELCKSQVISPEMENAICLLKEGLEKAEEVYLCAEPF